MEYGTPTVGYGIFHKWIPILECGMWNTSTVFYTQKKAWKCWYHRWSIFRLRGFEASILVAFPWSSSTHRSHRHQMHAALWSSQVKGAKLTASALIGDGKSTYKRCHQMWLIESPMKMKVLMSFNGKIIYKWVMLEPMIAGNSGNLLKVCGKKTSNGKYDMVYCGRN